MKHVVGAWIGLLLISSWISGCGGGDSSKEQIASVSQAANSDHLVMTFEGAEVGVPATPKFGTTFDVDWNGDGVFSGPDEVGFTGEATHTFADDGPHTIRVSGQIASISFWQKSYAENLVSVDQWGTSPWNSFYFAFAGCVNLTTVNPDPPDLSTVNSFENTFYNATSFEGDVSQWEVDGAVSMAFMFFNASSFDGDLSTWEVGDVQSMRSMFSGASSFNGDISDWTVDNVTTMAGMFLNASSFNGDISAWEVSKVENMLRTFEGASDFEGDISSWTVTAVEDMRSMFNGASSFDADISGWSVDSLTMMGSMFVGAESFDWSLGGWDVSKVTDMVGVFVNSGISQESYDATLNGWGAQQSLQSGVQVGANRLTYCDGAAARQSLIDDFNWSFIGDIRNCCGNGDIDDGEVCDDGVNDGTDGSCATDCSAFVTNCYPDVDGDSFGSSSAGVIVQLTPSANICRVGTALNNTDCDDNPAACGAGCRPRNTAADLCDGFNQDCDASTDEDFVGAVITCGDGACAATGTEVCQSGEVVDACTPGTAAGNDATCDGVDNDCNGETDEDYVPVVTSCGVGACSAAGTTSCDDGDVFDSCTAGAPAANDATCDGIDNDCNGFIDDGFVSAATNCGQGACSSSGSTSCVNGTVNDSCTPGIAALTDATCDGVDNDCDGSTDEEYSSQSTSCGVGACGRTGATSCVGGTVNDSCTPGTASGDDATCDGVDDDCDGTKDEDYVAPATSCGVGACASNGLDQCQNGTVVDSCVAGTAADDDMTCDDIDDDCDGDVDDDYVATATSCGTGACGGSGTLSCVDGDEVDSCSSGSGDPTDESCNGIDDDCDDETDEDYMPSDTTCGVGACRSTGTRICSSGSEIDTCTPGTPIAANDTTCDGVDDDCDGRIDEDYAASDTICGVGLCASTGRLTCAAGNEVDSCSPNPGAATDATCDGVDDDCSGEADEDYAQTSTSCGVGACANTGLLTCDQGVEVDSCSVGTPAANDATCDGVDDDCSGAADEDYTATNTVCGQGACAATGALTCVAGVESDSCSSGAPALVDATCDGVDDDCDGQNDEDYSTSPTSCGVGACVDSGVLTCMDGVESDSCEPGTSADNDATCDGVDDDCDGTNDENYVTSASSCGLGVCVATGTLTCVGGAVRDSCSAGTPADLDMVCDGRDEDCDGDVDEDATACFECDEVDDCPTLANECRQYACVAEVCEISDVPQGASCDDDLFCTTTDACDGSGTCVGTGQPCALGAQGCDDAGDFCNNCLVATDCADDGNDCTERRCVVSSTAANTCENPALDAGVACADDGAFCTGAETCDGAGSCASAGDPCTGVVACNEAADNCAPPCGDGLVASGEICDDGSNNGDVGSCSATCDGYVVACFADSDEDGFGSDTGVEVVAAAADTLCENLTGPGGESLTDAADDCDDTEESCTTDCEDVDDDDVFDCADGCIDADGDNFGVGDTCTDVDCDDADPSCFTDCSVRAPGFGCIDAQICAKELSGQDSDSDGLPDFYEDLLCVDTNNALTDDDTLNDFVELCEFGTNPCSADTDKDGFDDDAEIDAGSDPLDARSVPEFGNEPPGEASGGSGAGGCSALSADGHGAPLGGLLLMAFGLIAVSRRRMT